MIHVVLFQPEIPQNTGNIMRTCVATMAHLHIIGPIPFNLDEKSLKRAGMDYIKDLKLTYYNNIDDFYKMHKNAKIFYITRYGKNRYDKVSFGDATSEIYIMFGKESTGIPKDILSNNQEVCLRLPMALTSRSLNLSNAVAIIVYEVLRQHNFFGLSTLDVLKNE